MVAHGCGFGATCEWWEIEKAPDRSKPLPCDRIVAIMLQSQQSHAGLLFCEPPPRRWQL